MSAIVSSTIVFVKKTSGLKVKITTNGRHRQVIQPKQFEMILLKDFLLPKMQELWLFKQLNSLT